MQSVTKLSCQRPLYTCPWLTGDANDTHDTNDTIDSRLSTISALGFCASRLLGNAEILSAELSQSLFDCKWQLPHKQVTQVNRISISLLFGCMVCSNMTHDTSDRHSSSRLWPSIQNHSTFSVLWPRSALPEKLFTVLCNVQKECCDRASCEAHQPS